MSSSIRHVKDLLGLLKFILLSMSPMEIFPLMAAQGKNHASMGGSRIQNAVSIAIAVSVVILEKSL